MGEKEDNFNYDDLWDNEEKRKDDNKIEEFSRGIPRKGIKGKYIKRKNHITKNQIKNSYSSYYKTLSKE